MAQFVAVCDETHQGSQGWLGPLRGTYAEAEQDGIEHTIAFPNHQTTVAELLKALTFSKHVFDAASSTLAVDGISQARAWSVYPTQEYHYSDIEIVKSDIVATADLEVQDAPGSWSLFANIQVLLFVNEKPVYTFNFQLETGFPAPPKKVTDPIRATVAPGKYQVRVGSRVQTYGDVHRYRVVGDIFYTA